MYSSDSSKQKECLPGLDPAYAEDLPPIDLWPNDPSASHSERLEQAEDSFELDPFAQPYAPATIPSLGTLDVGDEFAGYRLLARLGKGAFGRVYLAEECNLARRLVVVKISEQHLQEPHALARLQHSHIVPIYSLHDDPLSGLQAVVMPYLGGTTLDCVLRCIGDPTQTSLTGRELLELVDSHTLATLRHLYQGEPGSSSDGLELSIRPVGSRSHTAEPNWSVTAPTLLQQVTVTRPNEQDPRSDPGKFPTGLLSRLRTWFQGAEQVVGESARDTLSKLTYEQAIQWIGARLAQALHHAHSRGVLHRDIKPGNILLAQDGRPLLLDFNLAYVQHAESVSRAIGGTLAYMSPEHLRAFRDRGKGAVTLDERADIFSFGVVLYEALTGTLPFPAASGRVDDEALDDLIESRYTPPPRLRRLNPRVSPALEAIVHRCLAPDPNQRYQSAAELAEDLQRDLDQLATKFVREPSVRYRLRKWIRRHPKLTLSLAATCMILAVIGAAATALATVGERAATVERRLRAEQFAERYRLARSLAYAAMGSRDESVLSAAQRACDDAIAAAAPSATESGPSGAGELSELHFLRALLFRVQAHGCPDRQQRRELYQKALEEVKRSLLLRDRPNRYALALKGELLLLLGKSAEGERMVRAAQSIPLESAEDYYLEACRAMAEADYERAAKSYEEALRRDPQHFWALFGLAQCHAQMGRLSEAKLAYLACLALWPDCAFVYLNRGVMMARAGQAEAALRDLSRAIELEPALGPAYAVRGVLYLKGGKFKQAASDLSYAVKFGPVSPELLVAYGTALAKVGDFASAQRHFERAFELSPNEADVAVASATALAEVAPRTALEWIDRAVRIDGRHPRAWYIRACILADQLHRPRLALDCVRNALASNPRDASALALEALLLARLGQTQSAKEQCQLIAQMDLKASDWYTLASCYAVLARTEPKWGRRSIESLRRAAQLGLDIRRVRTDRDFKWLREQSSVAAELQQLIDAIDAPITGRLQP